jgi:two-component system NtrC family response regulator
MATLIVTRDGKELSQYPIRKKIIIIGRSPQCDLVLADNEVSSLHANIMNQNEQYQVVDLNSTNSTFINGTKVVEQTLNDQDEIGIGRFAIRFVLRTGLEQTVVTDGRRDPLEQSQALLQEIKKAHLTAVTHKAASPEAEKVIARSLEELDAHLLSAKKANEQLKTMLDLAEAVNSAKGFTSVLELLLNRALAATGMERGVIVLFNEQKELEPAVWVRMENEVRDKEKPVVSSSIIRQVIESGEVAVLTDVRKNGEWNAAESIVAQQIQAVICLPLRSRTKKVLGALYLDSRFPAADAENTRPEFLRMFSLFAATAIETRQAGQREKQMSEELAAAREREKYQKQLTDLEKENIKLVKKIREQPLQSNGLLGVSEPIRKMQQLIEKVAPTDLSVLITGETGTGKSLAAKSIHELSLRRGREFVTIDCASIPKDLLESELFGHEKGSFTGAVALKKGRIEMADGGTLFLDEIGDMSLALQAKLLRFLQEKTFDRVGGNKPISVDVRVVAATNMDLKQAVAQKTFREDLYYRLCGIVLHISPLRERGEDALVLATTFLNDAAEQNKLILKGFTPEARNIIVHYVWNGNVRQLKNVIQRAAIMAEGEFIKAEDLGLDHSTLAAGKPRTLKDAREEVDSALIRQQLLAQKGNFSRVARILDIDRSTLRALMKKYEIEGSDSEDTESV